MAHEFFNPVRSICGAASLATLPELLGGRTATLVTFPDARSLGLVDRLQQLLGPALVQVIDDVRPHPDQAGARGRNFIGAAARASEAALA